MGFRRICYGAVAIAALASAGHAQVVPGTANPGRIPERFTPPATPQSVPEVNIPGPEAVPPPDRAGQTKFVLTSIIIDGASAIPAREFEPLYAGLLGRCGSTPSPR